MRALFATLGAVALALGFAAPASGNDGAAKPQWRHGTALTGEPKYAQDFAHFDYVNADAPKGGRVRLAAQDGFDSFNPIVSRGDAAPGLSLIYDSLFTPALDEAPSATEYGLIAEAMRYPDDYAWAEYRLDPRAAWHDGTPITVEDVIWSFESLVAVNPRYSFYYSDVESVEAVGDDTVRFTFKRAGNRELPKIVGQLLVLPKHWWTAEGRSIERTTLTPPLGGGAYKIARFEAGRSITYERAPEYWAADHPTQIGTDNFAEISYDVYRDVTVLVEALKADRIDFRIENSAKNWANAYDTEALEDGRLVKETFPDESRGIMQAFVMNLRLPKFQDARVRRALNLAYDFESQKETIFFGQYERIASYFENTELAARGLPEGEERDILESVRDLVPPKVFTEPYTNPVGGNPQNVRNNLREAVRLLREAGYELRDNTMVNAETGEPLTIELVDNQPSVERYVLPYQQSLRRIGIDLSLRIVDTSQYINRVRERDFEMTVLAFPQSLSPGNEQLDFWGSAAADLAASNNYAGIKDPGVDALIDKVILADDRETLVAATRALDRVLLAHDYMIPLFYAGEIRTIRWDRFGHPDDIPPYTTGFPTIWWYDEEKAAELERRS